MSNPFRSTASFGKRIEFYIVGLMLKDGLDVYLPLVDDHGVDALIMRKNGSIAQVQIKACSEQAGEPASFPAVACGVREDYWFAFHSESLKRTWLMTAQEFLANARGSQKHKGEYAINFAKWSNGVAEAKENTKPSM